LSTVSVSGRVRALRAMRELAQRIAGLWESLSIYLPMLLMGLLAVATYWLVRNTPDLVERDATRPAVHEVDYLMRGATIKTFDETGRLKTALSGTEIRHYADNDTVEVDRVRLRATAPDGRLTVASATRALSKDDGSQVQLIGNAVVQRDASPLSGERLQPRLEFRGEFLHIFANEERITSHLPVTLRRGNDEFTADRFSYDHLGRLAELQGRVKGRLLPATAGSSAPVGSP
jgi:lipopolysaccharide export system protein LptC